MSTTTQQLQRIAEKLQELLKEHGQLKKENKRLQSALEEVNKKNKVQQQHVDELKEQVSILKAGAGKMNDTDKKDLEKRLSTYLKEIDRCIALLSE
jgi:predicted nuclease with TOPRIM domain